MIRFPKFPEALKSDKTDVKVLAQECTALLQLDATNSYEWLTDSDRQNLTAGKTLARRNVLYKHYVCSLESARQAALKSGFAEPGILPENVLMALSLCPFNHLTGRQSRDLRDAIGAVKRLDDESSRAEAELQRAQRRTSGGRSPSKAAKSARDKAIRAGMQQPKGQSPKGGRKAS